MCCPDDDDDDDDDDVKEVDATNHQNHQQPWNDLDANPLRYEYSKLIIRQKIQQ